MVASDEPDRVSGSIYDEGILNAIVECYFVCIGEFCQGKYVGYRVWMVEDCSDPFEIANLGSYQRSIAI